MLTTLDTWLANVFVLLANVAIASATMYINIFLITLELFTKTNWDRRGWLVLILFTSTRTILLGNLKTALLQPLDRMNNEWMKALAIRNYTIPLLNTTTLHEWMAPN